MVSTCAAQAVCRIGGGGRLQWIHGRRKSCSRERAFVSTCAARAVRQGAPKRFCVSRDDGITGEYMRGASRVAGTNVPTAHGPNLLVHPGIVTPCLCPAPLVMASRTNSRGRRSSWHCICIALDAWAAIRLSAARAARLRRHRW